VARSGTGTLKLLSILGTSPLDFGREMAGDLERIFEETVGEGPRKFSFRVVEKRLLRSDKGTSPEPEIPAPRLEVYFRRGR
jgi:hypothetical protein